MFPLRDDNPTTITPIITWILITVNVSAGQIITNITGEVLLTYRETTWERHRINPYDNEIPHQRYHDEINLQNGTAYVTQDGESSNEARMGDNHWGKWNEQAVFTWTAEGGFSPLFYAWHADGDTNQDVFGTEYVHSGVTPKPTNIFEISRYEIMPDCSPGPNQFNTKVDDTLILNQYCETNWTRYARLKREVRSAGALRLYGATNGVYYIVTLQVDAKKHGWCDWNNYNNDGESIVYETDIYEPKYAYRDVGFGIPRENAALFLCQGLVDGINEFWNFLIGHDLLESTYKAGSWTRLAIGSAPVRSNHCARLLVPGGADYPIHPEVLADLAGQVSTYPAPTSRPYSLTLTFSVVQVELAGAHQEGCQVIYDDPDLIAYANTTDASDNLLVGVSARIGEPPLGLQEVDGKESALSLAAQSQEAHVLDIYRNPPLQGGLSNQWAIGTYFNNQGAYYSDAWMIISGQHESTPSSAGHYDIRSPLDPTVPFMLGVWADVDGPAVVIRGSGISPTNSYPLSVISSSSNYVFSVEDDGALMWGAGARADMDTVLERTAAGILHTPGIMSVGQELRIGGSGTGNDLLRLVANGSTVQFQGVDIKTTQAIESTASDSQGIGGKFKASTGRAVVTIGGGGTTLPALALSYNNDGSYSHFIRGVHSGGSGAGNKLEFYTGNGTAAGVFPTHAILGLTIENGSISTPGNAAVQGGLTVSGNAAVTGSFAANGGITSGSYRFDTTGPTMTYGSGAPTGSPANGSIYLRTDGGSGTTFYVRENGAWVAK